MIDNQRGASTELVIIIGYPARPSRIIIFIKNSTTMIVTKSKKEKKKEKMRKEIKRDQKSVT